MNATQQSRRVVLVTGASNGIGRLAALTLSRRGDTAFASMRDVKGRNAEARRD